MVVKRKAVAKCPENRVRQEVKVLLGWISTYLIRVIVLKYFNVFNCIIFLEVSATDKFPGGGFLSM